MKEGDVACIFLGADLPYILRPVDGGRFALVGDAYLYGIMDGEFMVPDPAAEAFELV
jgi:hypothetical protein